VVLNPTNSSDRHYAVVSFLTPAAILAWRLLLPLLAPRPAAAPSLRQSGPQGTLLVANHGPEEADLGGSLCAAAGSAGGRRGTASCGLCRYREATPVVCAGRACARDLNEIVVIIRNLLYYLRRFVNNYLVRFWSPRRSGVTLATTYKAGFFDPGGRHS
jgi:hypothetical protein